MVDFHTHVLPKIDDGSRSVAESRKMLRELSRQNVTTVCATPHFYAEQSSPSFFFRKRQIALEALLEADAVPKSMELRPGAEVLYYPGISNLDCLSDFCIRDTNLLLLEMPFQTWSSSVVREVTAIAQSSELHPILAHVERYRRFTKKAVLEELKDNGVLLQSNAACFLGILHGRNAVRSVTNGWIDILGSDCHNMKERRPNMSLAHDRLVKSLGVSAAEAFFASGEQLLKNASNLGI